MRWAGDVARMEKVSTHKILVETSEGKKPLGIPRRKWEGNIKMSLKEIGLKGVDKLMWFRKGKMAISCEGGKKASSSIKYMGFLD